MRTEYDICFVENLEDPNLKSFLYSYLGTPVSVRLKYKDTNP